MKILLLFSLLSVYLHFQLIFYCSHYSQKLNSDYASFLIWENEITFHYPVIPHSLICYFLSMIGWLLNGCSLHPLWLYTFSTWFCSSFHQEINTSPLLYLLCQIQCSKSDDLPISNPGFGRHCMILFSLYPDTNIWIRLVDVRNTWPSRIHCPSQQLS